MGTERREWHARREEHRADWTDALSAQVAANDLANAGLPVRSDGGRKTIGEWLTHDTLSLGELAQFLPDSLDVNSPLAGEMAEDAAYRPYLERQDRELRDLRASAALHLGPDFPYAEIPGLSNEMTERLTASAPATLADAQRVRGITPAALAAVLVHARRREKDVAA